MKVDNRAFWIVCIGVIAITAYLRAQSLQTKAAAAVPVTAAPAQSPAPRRPHPIPDSPMPPDNFAANSDAQAGDDSPVTVDSSELPQQQAQTSAPTGDNAAENGNEDDLTNTDDIGDLADPSPTNNSLQFSDRDMLRVMMTQMTDSEQQSFRMMWFTMTPDDRQDFLDQLRGQQGG